MAVFFCKSPHLLLSSFSYLSPTPSLLERPKRRVSSGCVISFFPFNPDLPFSLLAPRITPSKLKTLPHSQKFLSSLICSFIFGRQKERKNSIQLIKRTNRRTDKNLWMAIGQVGKALTLSQTRAARRALPSSRGLRRWPTTVTSSTLLLSKSTISNW